jgi:hypothetical protein
MIKISKSRYTSFVTCPKQFWLTCHKPELAEETDASLEMRFEQGTEIGEVALNLFNGVENTTVRLPDGKLDIGAMCETAILSTSTTNMFAREQSNPKNSLPLRMFPLCCPYLQKISKPI